MSLSDFCWLAGAYGLGIQRNLLAYLDKSMPWDVWWFLFFSFVSFKSGCVQGGSGNILGGYDKQNNDLTMAPATGAATSDSPVSSARRTSKDYKEAQDWALDASDSCPRSFIQNWKFHRPITCRPSCRKFERASGCSWISETVSHCAEFQGKHVRRKEDKEDSAKRR